MITVEERHHPASQLVTGSFGNVADIDQVGFGRSPGQLDVATSVEALPFILAGPLAAQPPATVSLVVEKNLQASASLSG
jgi:hypothetical protein